jgi:AraC-like DNA-binding protein
LTAKADIQSRLDGLGHGADAYLAKPFEKKELFIRLQKLLELRAQLKLKYASAESSLVNDGDSPPEDRFTNRLRTNILHNITDDEYGILDICRTMLMSRTQLHRKIKAITGESTSIYIRSIRLQEAKKILESQDLNISEVAYKVGFRDPKYFSRVFTEKYGVPPTRLRI